MQGNGNEAAQRRPTIRGTFQETMIKLLIVYMITTYAFKQGVVLTVPAQTASTPSQVGQKAVEPSQAETVRLSGVYRCAFDVGEPMTLRVFVSDFEKHEQGKHNERLVYENENLKYVGNMEALSKEVSFDLTERMLNNGTMYLHAYLSTQFRRAELHIRLNRFMPPPQPEKYKNLLESSADERAEVERLIKEHQKKPWISYWKDNVTLAFVSDMYPIDLSKLPQTITEKLVRDDPSKTFLPIFFVHDFWTYKDHFYPINDTLKTLPLRLDFQSMSMWKWQLMTQMEESFATQQQWGMASEIDEMKRMLSETNPWFLGLTAVVSIVHMVFDFLAFKNDISFWKSRKSLEGLSVRSILISFGCQLIIFLYLLDNETSWMILLSAGVGVGIEGWKITKTNDVTVSKKFPFIHLKDKSSYISKTKSIDEDAMRYLSYVVYPLVVVYAIYALVYESHKSYYSWFIGSLSGAVYMFGFLQMTPQLFINYKLKSVAHLPWRVFVYKALNTFIDDMFAFIIKMPIMHRLSVFRDDIIFFIFLYQRWLYRVDKSRVNEFGQSFEEEEEEKKQKKEKIDSEREKKAEKREIEKID